MKLYGIGGDNSDKNMKIKSFISVPWSKGYELRPFLLLQILKTSFFYHHINIITP